MREDRVEIGLLYFGQNLFGPPPETPDYDVTELAYEAHPYRFYDYVEWQDYSGTSRTWSIWQQIDPTYRPITN